MTTYLFNRYHKLILSVFLFCSLILCSVCDGFCAAGTVWDESLRLHVLAASDSEEDQRVKLLVRDALLTESGKLFCGSENAREAAEKIIENKEELENIADKVLQENGFSYRATVSIEDEYFETREYDEVKLPAGTYTACKVVLGDGDGKNWWCIMFPPLCIPAATAENEESVYAVYGEKGGNLVTGKSGYVIKFRIVEIIEEIINKVKS